MTENLKAMGASIEAQSVKCKAQRQENIIIRPVKGLKGAKVKSFGDHRTAMSMIIAGLAAEAETVVDDVSCIDKSFPGFVRQLKKLKFAQVFI